LSSRTFPVAAAQQAVQPVAEIVKGAVEDEISALLASSTRQNRSAIPAAELKFFHALMAAKAE
jgi:hypothetical protein